MDILDVDNKIRHNFREEKQKLSYHKDKIKDIQKSLELKNLRPKVYNTLIESEKELKKYIEDLENDTSINFYITETAILIEKYREILAKPEKVNFMGKKQKTNKEKTTIIEDYIKLASKYVNIDIEKTKEPKTNNNLPVICNNCSNKKDFEIIDLNTYICSLCSSQQTILKNITSYRDSERVNITPKYIYDRRVHFRDSIAQFQGKQNSTIEPEVYTKLEKQFELHRLLVGDKITPKKIRFQNITKEHINMFLKDLDFSKHYENINLIHYNMTGKKPHDIGYLEDKLLDDFDTLTETYDKLFKHITRKNFINTSYILHKLLIKHKYPCTEDDFTSLKTVDRKAFHDDIFREICAHLEWSFKSSM